MKYQEAPFVAFYPISGFWLTEEAPGLLAMLSTISTFGGLLSPLAHVLPSATVSVILCEAPVILNIDAGLNVHAKGPLVQSWVPIFRTEGRISFSKCLACKYVTSLETDTMKNR